MSKYKSLWNYIFKLNKNELAISFDEIKKICGVEIDHSFLKYKKELFEFGYKIKKISIKDKLIYIEKLNNKAGE